MGVTTSNQSSMSAFPAASTEKTGDGATKIAADKNLENTKNIITQKQHPSPAVLIMGMLVVLTVVYLFWAYFIQKSPEGKWVNETSGDVYMIEYDRLMQSAVIYLTTNPSVHVRGKMRQSIISLNNDKGGNIGLWTDTTILWTDQNGDTKTWKMVA
jgi:hypothetical protein